MTPDAWTLADKAAMLLEGRPAVRAVAALNGAVACDKAADVEAPKPLPDELLPVKPFPMDALPDAFAPLVEDVTERMNCPPDFVAVPKLVAAASLVARCIGIRPQRQTDWTERGNLWGLVVARPGFMKSPAMLQALGPLDRLEARAAEAFNSEAAQHRTDALVAKLRFEAKTKTARDMLKDNPMADIAATLADDSGIDEPSRRRYMVGDLTYESAGILLDQNPSGLLLARDEINGMLRHLAREEFAQARGFFLQSWSGGRYIFDRVGRGNVTIDDLRLSIIGCIQPGPLANLILQARRGAADDGMIERFLIAWPDDPGEWRDVDRWPDTEGRRRAWAAFERLDGLTVETLRAECDTDVQGNAHGLPFLRFDEDARKAFVEWRSGYERTIRQAEGEGLESALSKFRHHVPALALTLHVIDGGTGPVTLAATERALKLAAYFESHTRRLHGSSRRLAVRAARTILDKARANALPNPFTARDVYRAQWSGLTDRPSVFEALDMLAAHGWLAEFATETGGRPTTIYSLVEPKKP